MRLVPDADWERVLATQRLIQDHFPECVLVGGTAAALHVHHRVSFDADSVLVDLRRHFDDVLARLEELAGWNTSRIRPPVLILGQLEGVDVGLRQLRRAAPLETTTISGLVVPTHAEMARIKGWLVVTRNALRDYLDFAALSAGLGGDFLAAMRPFDNLYPQRPGGETSRRQLMKQLAEPRPYDFDPDHEGHTLTAWRALTPPWTDWMYTVEFCRQLADQLMTEALA